MRLLATQDTAASVRDIPARALSPKHDIVLLSTDPALRAAIQGAIGRDAAVWCVTSAQNAVGTLVAGRCAIFIADLTLIGGEYATLFKKLAEQFPDLVLIAAGGRIEERLARPLLSNGVLYRFIHMPVSHARAASFMAAALRRHEELKALQTTMLTTMKTLAAAKPRWSIGVTTVIALLAVVIAAMSFNFNTPQTADAPMAAPATTSAPSAGMDELLASARTQMSARHFVTPDHRGALDLYHAATLIDSTNLIAQDGLQQALDAVIADAEKALHERNASRALEDIGAVKRVRPTHPRLPMLESRAAQLSLSKRYPQPKQPVGQ